MIDPNTPSQQLRTLVAEYSLYRPGGLAPLEMWETEGLIRLGHLVDVELQERDKAFKDAFPSPFDNVDSDDC